VPRHIAFLRAINVGGRFVTMDRLRKSFEELGFDDVATFIASGNVIFDTRSASAPAIASKIEKAMRKALGYEVATFVRTDRELAAIAAHQPFSAGDLQGARAFVVGFLAEPLTAGAVRKLMALGNAIDRFAVNNRELYWLSRQTQSGSTFSNALFERTLGVKSTFRGMKTITRLAAKYPCK